MKQSQNRENKQTKIDRYWMKVINAILVLEMAPTTKSRLLEIYQIISDRQRAGIAQRAQIMQRESK